jgi:hypothetical protein
MNLPICFWENYDGNNLASEQISLGVAFGNLCLKFSNSNSFSKIYGELVLVFGPPEN